MMGLLGRLLKRGVDPTQLALDFAAQRRETKPATPRVVDKSVRRRPSGDALLAQLCELGLRRITSCALTRNRNVMVSFRGSHLRVHEAYCSAPHEVLRALVVFVEGRTRAERLAARKTIVSFAATPLEAPARRERPRPEDAPIIARLTECHALFNERHFAGTLREVPVRVSRRMKSRLGHYSAATKMSSAEIAISWRHIRRHPWSEVLDTLLHEMVHQWQDETGRPIDHGSGFRAKAREVGITPAARRVVTKGRGGVSPVVGVGRSV